MAHPSGYFDPQAAHPHAGDLAHFPQHVFLYGIVCLGGFALLEMVAAWAFHSLALWGDVAHMLSDLIALSVSWVAQKYGQKGPSMQHSYGFGRLEILAAFFNGLLMVGLVCGIVWEAIDRFNQVTPVNGWGVIAISGAGLVVNTGIFWLFHRTRSNSLHIRSLLLHIIGDWLGSLAALVAGICIVLYGAYILDPVLSLLICGLIAINSYRLIKEAVHVLMEGVPSHLDLQTIGCALAAIPGVRQVHDLHVWSLSSGTVALSVHVILHDLQDWIAVHQAIKDRLRQDFQIMHTTIQPELHADLSDEALHAHHHAHTEGKPG